MALQFYEWWVGYVTRELQDEDDDDDELLVEVSFYGGRDEKPWVARASQVVPLVEGWAEGVKTQRIGAKGNPEALWSDVEEAVAAYLTSAGRAADIRPRSARWSKYCTETYKQLHALEVQAVNPLPVLLEARAQGHKLKLPPKAKSAAGAAAAARDGTGDDDDANGADDVSAGAVQLSMGAGRAAKRLATDKAKAELNGAECSGHCTVLSAELALTLAQQQAPRTARWPPKTRSELSSSTCSGSADASDGEWRAGAGKHWGLASAAIAAAAAAAAANTSAALSGSSGGSSSSSGATARGSLEAAALKRGLFESVRAGDVDAVRRIVAQDIDVKAVDPRTGEFPLHMAVQLGTADMTALVLETHQSQGQRWYCRPSFDMVNMYNRHGQNPLHLALSLGRAALVPLLVPYISNVNCKGRCGFPPLAWAATAEVDAATCSKAAARVQARAVAAEALIKACTVVHRPPAAGECAGAGGRPLLNVNALDGRACSALYWSTVYQLPALGMLLLQHGASFTSQREITAVCADISLGVEPVPIHLTQHRNAAGEIVLPRFFYYAENVGNPLCEKGSSHSSATGGIPSCSCSGVCGHKCPCTAQNGQQLPYRSDGSLANPSKTVIYECGPQCKCTCGEDDGGCLRTTQGGIGAPLQVFYTEKKGWGVRTLQDINRWQFVFLYTGTYKAGDNGGDAAGGEDINYHEIEIVDYKDNALLRVDAQVVGNVARLVNHSCDPNLVLRKLAFFTNKFVPAGTELSWSYNGARRCDGYQPCNCESDKCKGHI
ncbi:hypothetical protein JKP88DRAFT_310780 [Tribonema minus]|uniref:Histone-lysine N-methyltransferase n=1 Tax=Tribonema minus TaxID=303371 RepID=A0A835Z3X2_9STRA|nr:hypothetical protein JKP88DRAFT_310780 [Tribonema minus]